MNITLPQNVEEWYAKGTFIDSDGNEVYCEIPAVFVDDVLDEVATQEKINSSIEFHNNILNIRKSRKASGT